MSNNDFWEQATGIFTGELPTAIDHHLSEKIAGQSFDSVRELTDASRGANALPLSTEAGTKVSFTGGLGAYMTYENPPPKGALGEVVNVKSANGDITHHDGKVFVQWDDGEFRSIHAEHLRLAGEGKTADLKQQFEKIKALAEKRPDSKFLKSVLKQMADKGFAPTPKQMAVVKKIEDEAKAMSSMQKELKSLGKAAKTFRVSNVGDLTEFLKVSEGQLIHKSTNDLWSMTADGDEFLIERLFDDTGEPLQG